MKYYMTFENFNNKIIQEKKEDKLEKMSNERKLDRVSKYLAKAKNEEKLKKISNNIGNALHTLSKIKPSTLSKREIVRYVKIADELKELSKEHGEDVMYMRNSDKRKARFSYVTKYADKLSDKYKLKEKPDVKKNKEDTESQQVNKEKDTNTSSNITKIKVADTTKKVLNEKVPNYKEILKRNTFPILSVNSNNPKLVNEIKLVQTILKYGEPVNEAINLYEKTVDGDYGDGTKNAVEKFQKMYNLNVDGVVGKGTWKALLSTFGINQDKEPTVLKANDYIEKYYTKDDHQGSNGTQNITQTIQTTYSDILKRNEFPLLSKKNYSEKLKKVVELVQNILKNVANNGIVEVNGIYDDNMEKAVKAFQESKNIFTNKTSQFSNSLNNVSGIIDKPTWIALLKLIGVDTTNIKILKASDYINKHNSAITSDTVSNKLDDAINTFLQEKMDNYWFDSDEQKIFDKFIEITQNNTLNSQNIKTFYDTYNKRSGSNFIDDIIDTFGGANADFSNKINKNIKLDPNVESSQGAIILYKLYKLANNVKEIKDKLTKIINTYKTTAPETNDPRVKMYNTKK